MQARTPLTPKKSLTPKMLALTQWIVRYRRSHGYSPTYGEMGMAFGGKSKVTMFHRVRTLSLRGLFKIEEAHRGVIPTRRAEMLTPQ